MQFYCPQAIQSIKKPKCLSLKIYFLYSLQQTSNKKYYLP